MAYHHSTVGDEEDTSAGIPRRYAWIVFALTFGLLISDYMSRQVLNAVFPTLKSEWALSDSHLGLLQGKRRPHGQAQYLVMHGFGNRQCPFRQPQAGISWLQMRRHRVMNQGAHPSSGQCLLQGVATRALHHI